MERVACTSLVDVKNEKYLNLNKNHHICQMWHLLIFHQNYSL